MIERESMELREREEEERRERVATARRGSRRPSLVFIAGEKKETFFRLALLACFIWVGFSFFWLHYIDPDGKSSEVFKSEWLSGAMGGGGSKSSIFELIRGGQNGEEEQKEEVGYFDVLWNLEPRVLWSYAGWSSTNEDSNNAAAG